MRVKDSNVVQTELTIFQCFCEICFLRRLLQFFSQFYQKKKKRMRFAIHVHTRTLCTLNCPGKP